jgi:hypothetical protein
MTPRFWTVTVADREVRVVAGTREAAEKAAARRVRAPYSSERPVPSRPRS